MNLGAVATQVRRGQPATFRASGQSMTTRVRNGEVVTVTPFPKDTLPKLDQIVLARVSGRWYLHLVTGVRKGQVQISNNHGHVNGWTSVSNVVGFLPG
jgi:hypothetical protein